MPLKPINLEEEDEEDDDDVAITAEEAQLRAARLQRELEEQNKFDCLCDGVTGAMSLVDSAFNALLELKDELLMHGLPPSLLASLVLATGKMYRSITDLHTPVRELTRLVSIYSVPWEQKSEQLKRLHSDYESKQRQLNIAIRKLQLIDVAARRMEREKIVNNWEKVFAKVSAAKTHGRRWKFMIEAFKQKVKDGIIPGDLEINDDEDSDDDEKSEGEEEDDHDETAAEKQRFMMSVITASPPQEEDTGSQPPASELESEADGSPSEVTDSSRNAEEMSPDMQPKKRHGVSFGPVDDIPKDVIIKPEMKDASMWTNEPEYETALAVRVYRPIEMTDSETSDIVCSLTLDGKTFKTDVLPQPSAPSNSLPAIEEVPDTNEEAPKLSRSKAGQRKSIGFAAKPVSPSSPSSSRAKSTKPSSILKKNKSSSDDDGVVEDSNVSDSVIIDKLAFDDIMFPYSGDWTDKIEIAVMDGEKNITSVSTFFLSELDPQTLPQKVVDRAPGSSEPIFSKKASSEENKDSSGVSRLDDLVTDPVFVKLQGIKEHKEDSHEHFSMGRLPLGFYVVNTEIPKVINKEVNTESIKELVKDVVGVDIEEISKDDILNILGREYHDVCTSAMSFTSSSTYHKSGFIAQEELEVIQEQHEKELRDIQAEYEIKLQQLILQMEQAQQLHFQPNIPVQSNLESQVADQSVLREDEYTAARDEVHFEEEIHEKAAPMRKARPGYVLPDWGSHLPKNVWVRMKMLTEEMVQKRQQLEARIRRQIAANVEKKLASQYKLQRANNTLRGPLQDVSLPAVFMPSRSGNVYNPRAHMYFHPAGTTGDLRLSQPPSIFQLPPLPEKARASVINLFDLSKNFQQNASSDWLTRIATGPFPPPKGSRATTATARITHLSTPNTPAPTANIPAFDS